MANLKAIFEQQVHPSYLKRKLEAYVPYSKQKEFVTVLEHAHCPDIYKAAVLKLFIQYMESEHRFVHEDLSEMYAQTFTTGTCQEERAKQGIASTDNIVHYHVNDHIKLSLYEDPNVISSQGSTGYRTWEASLALLEYMNSLLPRFLKAQAGHVDKGLSEIPIHFNDLRTMPIVELGAGTGFVGMMLAQLSGQKATLTDGDQGVVEKLQRNIELNSLQTKCKSQVLYWGRDPPIVVEPGRKQLLLAADVTYDEQVAPLLVKCIKQFLTTTNTPMCFVSATIRSVDTFNAFIKECKRQNVQVTHLEHYTSPFDKFHFFVAPHTPDIVIMGLTHGEKRNG